MNKQIKRVIGLGVMLAAASGIASAEPAPQIACDEPVYNFGTTNQVSISHEWTIKNEGDLTLEITKIRPACGCTVAKMSNRSIPPGKSEKLSAKLSLRGRKGKLRKTISVYSNDPKKPNMRLAFEGIVREKQPPMVGEQKIVPLNDQPKIEPERLQKAIIIPPELYIPDAGSSEVTRYILIRYGAAGSFNITRIEPPSPETRVSYVPISRNGYRLKVTMKNPAELHGKAVKLHTDSKIEPVISIPIATHR